MKDHNICSQYYKDPETGVEMLFRFDTQLGWMMSFPVNITKFPEGFEKNFIPGNYYPPTPEQYKEQIDKF